MSFYKLEISRSRKFIEQGTGNDWESVVCPRHSGHQRAGKRITKLFLDVLSWNVMDFSRTMLSDIVITDRTRKVLQDAKLTGFTVSPTELAIGPQRRDGATFPKLWEFVVVGKGGPAHADSGIQKLRECKECGLVEYSAFKSGIIVEPSVYDGSDFFSVVEYPKYVLVSERAKTIIEDNHLSNATFIESTQLKWPKGVIKLS